MIHRIRKWCEQIKGAQPGSPAAAPEAKASTIAKAAAPVSNAPPKPAVQEDPSIPSQQRLLAEVASGLWQLRQKMLEPGAQEPRPELRRIYRHVESLRDLLSQAGWTVQDHQNEPFDAGQALRVLAFQPVAGMQRETVIETIKPSVYYHHQQIQVGEVIVGTPPPAEASPKIQDQEPKAGSRGLDLPLDSLRNLLNQGDPKP
jgi:hypothetical protein